MNIKKITITTGETMASTPVDGTLPTNILPTGVYRGVYSGWEIRLPREDGATVILEMDEGIRGAVRATVRVGEEGEYLVETHADEPVSPFGDDALFGGFLDGGA